MKIAVLSDIHGNMEALQAVMKEIDSIGCDKIFVLGDLAMAGPEPVRAVEYFMQKDANSHYSIIQGNTDFMIANYDEQLYECIKEKAPVMAEALRDDVKLLNPVEKYFLKNLPIQLMVDVEGVKFLLVHGSPRKNNEDILPDTPIDKVEEMLVNVDADVVLCGHTHLPCGFQTSKKITVVNAGSVGRPFTPEPKACFLIITAENKSCIFEHRFVDYNKEHASNLIKKRTFSGADKLAQTILNPQSRHF